MSKSRIVAYLFILLFPGSQTQAQIWNNPEIEIENNAYLAGGKMLPFWIASNQWGKLSAEPHGNVTSLRLISSSFRDKKHFNLRYGLEAVNRFDERSDLWLHQGFVKADYRQYVRFSAGLWEETMGNQYAPLSSGGIIWSRNARPLPKVELGTAGFVPMPFAGDKLEVQASMAQGWFEKERYSEHLLLHQKYIHFRTTWNFPMQINFGFYHFAQWGGSNPKYGNLPSDWEAFYRVFLAKEGGSDAAPMDQNNKAGNHVGSEQIGLTWEDPARKAGFYYQNVFDDGSGLRMDNFPDGLWGLWIENRSKQPLVKSVLYEFLYTEDQSGPVHDPANSLVGDDNYFNHGNYQSGWTAHRMTIGTPFITSPLFNQPVFQPDAPTGYEHRLMNTRVVAHHAGITGSVSENLTYKVLGSFSRNRGLYDQRADLWRPEVYDIEAPLDQWSFRGDLIYLRKSSNLETTLTIAADMGEMYGNNWGVMLGMKIPVFH